MGFFLGMCEGALLLLFQNPSFFYMHMVGPAVLFIAPVVDALAFALGGGILGLWSARAGDSAWGRRLAGMVGWFAGGSYATFLVADAWLRSGNDLRVGVKGASCLGGAALVTIAGLAALVRRKRQITGLPISWPPSRRLLWTGAIGWSAVIASAFVLHITAVSPARQVPTGSGSPSDQRPNIILISLDTARADHFSIYGYTRETTPNIDKLAKQGVVFDTAIANAPWTLPSFGSVFTGLLPHQHGLGGRRPLPAGFLTLASVLRSRGYQTAGFNANYTHGTMRTGLAQGFDVYDDDDSSLRSDLANIGCVKAFWSFFYYPFVRPDTLVRRNARQLNRPVFRWLRQRPREPFCLFVNYFDPHEPYSGVPAGGKRFGDTGDTVWRRIGNEFKSSIMGIEVPQTPAERAQLITRYDDTLSYVDAQIGELLRVLQASPEWANTYVILFSDHGQALGDHGNYGHLCGVNWELLHVALVIKGPGVSPGERVSAPVGLEQLFSTILNLSRVAAPDAEKDSLSCYWKLPADQCSKNPAVVSEFFQGIDEPSYMSLVTPGWHLISESTGAQHLYRLAPDPGEEVDIAASSDQQSQLHALQARLLEELQASSRPWPGDLYLTGLGDQGFSRLTGKHLGDLGARRTGTEGADRELLKSLPYQ